MGIYDDYDYADARIAKRERRRQDAEYEKGKAEAERYLSDRKIYGAELADQWEMEAEMARYNRGEDY